MTISHTTQQNWPPRAAAPQNKRADAPELPRLGSAISFSIGPEASPAQAVENANAMVAMTLPRFLAGAPRAAETCTAAQAVLTELVDVTARHKAGQDLVGRVAFDGAHVTISIGDMAGPLPAPEEEPGLYLVHRMAEEVGQYAGDMGGKVTWAAVAVGT